MKPWEIAAAYHERTKHHYNRYARSLGRLDWANQPNPFRCYKGTPLSLLPLSGVDSSPPYDDLFKPEPAPTRPLTIETVGLFFELSLAISAWKQYGGVRWALRVNPSSGNLHPTEGYALLPEVTGLHNHPGIYHYAPRAHGLERRCEFSEELWAKLTQSFPAGTFLVGLSSIHWREAWKYGERAYRYCQHDVGHALAALAIAATTLGWRVKELAGPGDPNIAALLGLYREGNFENVEREHADLLAAVITGGDSPDTRADVPPEIIESIAAGQWHGSANRLSAEHVDWEAIKTVEEACLNPGVGSVRTCFVGEQGARQPRQGQKIIDHGPSHGVRAHRTASPGRGDRTKPLNASSVLGTHCDPCAHNASELEAPIPPHKTRKVSAHKIIRQRRSALAMDGHTSIDAKEFYQMLGRVMPNPHRTPWSAMCDPVFVDLGLFVHRVRNIHPGLYCLLRNPAHDGPLRSAMYPSFRWDSPASCPDHLPLYLLQACDCRALAAQVSCGQDIAGDGAFSLGMIAEFEAPLRKYGAWIYRRLFWETGMIGQVLYLEAEAAGIRSTGIGCFFDDPVHEAFGLKGMQFQSLYHFTVGGPVDDPRLTTLPAYDPNSPRQES